MTSAKEEETTPSALAQVARAFAVLEELKLRIRMKPAPKPVDVAALDLAKRKRQAPAKGFTETAQEAKPKLATKPPETAE